MASAERLPVTLQERDYVLLRGLFESRLMTLSHLSALYFEGRAESAKKRVQKLKRGGVIGERPRRPYEPSVLFLTQRGFKRLASEGRLNDYPRLSAASFEKRARISELTLKHELSVMDVKVALAESLAKTENFSLVECSTWPALFQFYAAYTGQDGIRYSDVLVKPDGFIRIHENEPDGGLSEHTFFLEVDRSTESQEVLAQRAACYSDYYRSGGLAVRYGYSQQDYRDFPFRVLMVFRNAERRNNAAERLLLNTPPILTQVWLTTHQEMLQQPLGAIWVRPLDYRRVTEETAYDPELRRDMGVYRRQPEREETVEAAIDKYCLLQDDE